MEDMPSQLDNYRIQIKKYTYKCERCGREFARNENLKKHMSKKSPCVNLRHNLREMGITSPAYVTLADPLPDDLPSYTGTKCPFCNTDFSTISNRNKHIRHFCHQARNIIIQDTITSNIQYVLNEILKYINDTPEAGRDDIIQVILQKIDSQNQISY